MELNTASLEELCQLPGIGPKKAEAIIRQRERRRFTRVTQLLLVKGIGSKTLRKLKPFIFVAAPSRSKRTPVRIEEPADRAGGGESSAEVRRE